MFDSDEYFRMKLQWKSVSEEQERRNSRLRDYRSLIGETQIRFFRNLSGFILCIKIKRNSDLQHNQHLLCTLSFSLQFLLSETYSYCEVAWTVSSHSRKRKSTFSCMGTSNVIGATVFACFAFALLKHERQKLGLLSLKSWKELKSVFSS